MLGLLERVCTYANLPDSRTSQNYGASWVDTEQKQSLYSLLTGSGAKHVKYIWTYLIAISCPRWFMIHVSCKLIRWHAYAHPIPALETLLPSIWVNCHVARKTFFICQTWHHLEVYSYIHDDVSKICQWLYFFYCGEKESNNNSLQPIADEVRSLCMTKWYIAQQSQIIHPEYSYTQRVQNNNTVGINSKVLKTLSGAEVLGSHRWAANVLF